MSAETITVRADLVAKDEASPQIRAVEESLAALERRFRSIGAAFSKGFGNELMKRLDEMSTRARAFGTVMSDTAARSTKSLNGETTAARELSAALRDVASAQDAVARGARGAAGGNRLPRGPSGTGNAGGHPGRNGGAGNDLRDVRARWRIREGSMKAEASAAAAQVRVQHDAFAQRLRDARYLSRVREASERAEMRHAAGLRREHDAMRRRAISASHHTVRHAQHAIRSVNHPVFQSPGFWLHAGAAFGVEAGHRIVEASEAFDTSMSRLRMFAPELDADKIRRQALTDSISLGVSADRIVDSISKSVRDGVPPAIAESLPKSIAQTAQVMGGDIERLTDSLAEGIQEATSMGWIKDKLDARRFLNLEAGLSTTAGNTSQKTEQFIAAGGLGHGKEMGLNLEKTMAFGAMLNSSGARTGQASARFMGQLSQNIPKMFDYYRSAVQSHKNTEEDRAVRSAPGRLGYGSIREMQKRLEEGPEGVLDFATRLQKLDDKTRKLVLQGFHFSEQGGAMLAELGSNGGAKGKAVLARAHELAEQKEANDYLTQKFAEWSKSLAFMTQQITAGWHAIENEIGDVLKADIVTPFRNWWVDLSKAIVGGDLRGRVHNALMGFVHGLGFDDVAALLKSLSSNVGTFDMAGFAQGLGEGVRAVVDSFHSFAGVFGGAGGLDARAVGRIAAEMFGLSIALHVVAPIVTTIGGIASAFLAVKAALSGAAWLARLTGLSSGLSAIVGVDLAAGAAGLISFAGALGVISAAVQALLSSGILPKVSLLPKDGTPEGIDAWLWGKNKDGSSARPAWVDRLTGGNAPAPAVPSGAPNPSAESPSAYWARKNRFMHPSSFDGDEGRSWRDLMAPAAYVTDGNDDASADNRDRDTAAMIGTSRAAQRIADRLDALVPKLSLTGTASTVSTVAGFGGGGGEGGGNANLRYGRGAAGGYRSTPGTGSYGNPSKSLLDLIAQSEGAGYNVSWGNGKFLPGGKEQNLTGKSLNEILALGDTMRRQPGARNSSALGRYQITGSTLRDLMKRMGLNGSEKFDEAMQDRLASKLISDEGPRALQRWEGLKRGTYMSRAQALLRSGSIASQPGDVSSNGGGSGSSGKAVDIAMSMQGAGERSAQQILGAYMHPGEWCADFVNGALKRAGINGSGSAMARSFSAWGHHVDPGAVQKGDVITERHGNHVGHVGLATGNVQRDKAGNVVAVEMVSGNYGHQVRRNWERRSIIDDIRRANPTPGDLAGAARGMPKGSTPAPHHAPVPHASMQSAQAAPVVIHAPIHVHGVTDPHKVAQVVGEHMASAQRRRYTDTLV